MVRQLIRDGTTGTPPLKRPSIRAQYTKVTIPKNRYGMRCLATFFLNESRNCLFVEQHDWDDEEQWHVEWKTTTPDRQMWCVSQTTSSTPKPRSESSAASLELLCHSIISSFTFFSLQNTIHHYPSIIQNFVEAKSHTVIKLPASQSKSIATNGHINLSYSEIVW